VVTQTVKEMLTEIVNIAVKDKMISEKRVKVNLKQGLRLINSQI
jgi:hypothetical protein